MVGSRQMLIRFCSMTLALRGQNLGGPSSICAPRTANSGLQVPESSRTRLPMPHALGQPPQLEWLPSLQARPGPAHSPKALPSRRGSEACSAAGFDQALTKPHFFVFICPCFLANKCHVFPTGLLSNQFILTLCGQGQVSAPHPSPVF